MFWTMGPWVLENLRVFRKYFKVHVYKIFQLVKQIVMKMMSAWVSWKYFTLNCTSFCISLKQKLSSGVM